MELNEHIDGFEPSTPERIVIQGGVELTLATPDVHDATWTDYNDYVRQLEAAWIPAVCDANGRRSRSRAPS
jgi:hypothetical protein